MPAGFDTSAASSAPAWTPAADAPHVSPRSSQRTAGAARRARMSRRPPDPWRDADAQTNVEEMARSLEARGRTPAQARLRRRFLKFVPVGSGARVLEVGCGTGVVVRDLAALVGRRGKVVGIDASRRLLDRARAVDEDVPRAPRRAGCSLRHRGRADRRALARWLHRRRRRRRVRADLELLRRRRDEVRMSRRPVGLALVAIVLAGLVSPGALAPPAAPALRPPPTVVGGAALRHVERLVAICPRPAGSTGAARARSSIVDELQRA